MESDVTLRGDPAPLPDCPPSPLPTMPKSPCSPLDFDHDRTAAPADARSPVGVLNAAALAKLAELDPKGEHRLLQRVLTAYSKSVVRLLPQLQTARRDANFDGIGYVAHTFKSSSASIGAVKVAALCTQVETMIRTRHLEGLDAHLDSMCGELALVLQAVTELLDGNR